ncbi:HAD family hydrolase [Bordetella bronchialis]|uniref:Haloacid dehalogenase n=1 Tax=Bordetella bronchialis TaxID=463025 RepID=A0A193FYT2_9BORD|nr:haloacid dehalogenase [Bordetella bronchialis]
MYDAIRRFRPDCLRQVALCIVLALMAAGAMAQEALLPSWNDSPARRAIISFVQGAATENGEHFVPQADRIAVFDNDGTLWSEQPLYFELIYSLDEVKAMAPTHPDWKERQPYKAVLDNDREALAQAGRAGMLEIVGVTHTDMTTQAFLGDVRRWTKTARHPRFNQPYTKLIYAPMLELLDYLRANEFKTYIVSGGEVEFMRAWAQDAYGIPPEQVIGSTFVTEYLVRDGRPVLMRTPKLDHDNDGPGKPVSINRFIGRQPVFAFGNSDGDLQMLQWTADGSGKRFAGLVHHTDAVREWAYDRDSKIGRLDKALDEARLRGWAVVDMKTDWKWIYPFEAPDRVRDASAAPPAR